MGLGKKKSGGLIDSGSMTPAWEVAIKLKIKELRRLEKQAFGQRHGKTDFYDYLKAVYNAWDWSDAKTASRVGRQVAKLCKIEARKNKSPIRIVIDATSNAQDRQAKSRWTQALQYAIRKKVRETAFKNFLRKNGAHPDVQQQWPRCGSARLGRNGSAGGEEKQLCRKVVEHRRQHQERAELPNHPPFSIAWTLMPDYILRRYLRSSRAISRS
jgi:hypothetical protein